MATFGDIKARIAGDLLRSDLTTQIAAAVPDAIRSAAANRYWFNEVRGLTFTTTPGTDFYDGNALADIPGLVEIDAMWITVNGQRRNMTAASPKVIDDYSEGNPSLGQPYLYARQADGLRLYRIPDLAYPVMIDATTRFAPLVNDSDTNPWLTEGERLIRALVKGMIFNDLVGDAQLADREFALAGALSREMLIETDRRLGVNDMAGWP